MDPSQIPPNVPLEQPPPGQTSDFAHPTDHRLWIQIVATLVVCVILSTGAVVARLATRIFILKKFGWDDGLCVLAFLLNIGLTVCFAGEIKSGLAFSNYNTSLRSFLLYYFPDWTFWNALFSLFLYFLLAAIKCSILMLYERLLSFAHTTLRLGVWLMVGLQVLILIGTTAGLLEFCHPVEKLFRPEVRGACNVSAKLFVAQASLSVITDLLILIPPIPVVWRLNAPKARKFGFIATLSIGLFVTSIGFARLGILITELRTPNLTLNIQYLGTYLAIFEVNFAIIAICVPALRQLSVRILQTYSQYRSSRKSNRISVRMAQVGGFQKDEEVNSRGTSIGQLVTEP